MRKGDFPGKLPVLAHCVLNPFSAIHDRDPNTDLAGRLVRLAIDNGVGLFQLPCPEITLAGSNRWAQSYEQYDTPFFHRHCERLLETPLAQLADQVADGKELVAAVGIAGSPSCGVFTTSSGPDFGGLLPGMKDKPLVAPKSETMTRQGHFIQALHRGFRHHSLAVNLVELPKAGADKSEEERFIEHLQGLLIS